MQELDQDLLRRIAAFTAPEPRALSVVLDLDPSTTATVPALATRVTALVDEAERRARTQADELDHEPAAALRTGVERIRSYLENEIDRADVRSLALYASGEGDAIVDVRLTQPWPDALHVGTHFALAPLLPTLERDRDVLLAVVGRERGTLACLHRGRIEDVDDRSRDGHGQHAQGGWSQARYERGIDREAEEHYRDLGRAIGELITPGSSTLLAVVCPEEQRGAFVEALPTHVRDALAGWITAEAHAAPAELASDIERILEERLAEEIDRELERVGTAGADGRAAAGWDEVLAAAWDARVDVLLVDGSSADAWECTTCGRGVTRPGACPVDGGALEPVDGGALESAVRGTVANGGTVRIAPADRIPDGVPAVAVLRFALSPTTTPEDAA